MKFHVHIYYGGKITPCYSKCGPWAASSSSSTWKLDGDAEISDSPELVSGKLVLARSLGVHVHCHTHPIVLERAVIMMNPTYSDGVPDA